MGHGVLTQGLGILWPLVKLHAWATRPQRERERLQRIELCAREVALARVRQMHERNCGTRDGEEFEKRVLFIAVDALSIALNEERW